VERGCSPLNPEPLGRREITDGVASRRSATLARSVDVAREPASRRFQPHRTRLSADTAPDVLNCPPMQPAKAAVRELLDRLPDDCSLDDILYHLYVVQKVGAGLIDSNAGDVVPHATAMQELRRRWSTEHGR
jgi:hypothetical protein